MDVYVNNHMIMKLVCTPQYLAELVLGRLFAEGIIRSKKEVEQMYICETGEYAKLILKNVEFSQQALKVVHPIDWKAEQIFSLVDHFNKEMPIYTETHGTHGCFWQEGMRYCSGVKI